MQKIKKKNKTAQSISQLVVNGRFSDKKKSTFNAIWRKKMNAIPERVFKSEENETTKLREISDKLF